MDTPDAMQSDRPRVEFGRCELHGRYMRAAGGQVFPCRNCEQDLKEGLSPEQSAQRAADRLNDRLDECGLVGRFRSVTLDSYIATTPAQRSVLQACKRFAATTDRDSAAGLMLLGSCGTGKSHLLAAMARHLALERDMSAMVTTPRAIVRRLRACWVKGSKETELGIIEGLSEDLDLLLLDEVGMGFGSDAELAQLFEILDPRYARGMPTVVAGNLNFPEMKAALGDRIFDRLREGAKVLACNWASHRGAG